MSAAGRSVGRRTQDLLRSGHLLARAMRFAVIGVLSGAVYAGVTALLVRLGTHPVAASVAGYALSVPVGFVGHRGFSFRSQDAWRAQGLRFVAVQALGVAVTALAMAAALWARADYRWGMAGAVVLVPLANFLMMNFWVFARRPQPHESCR